MHTRLSSLFFIILAICFVLASCGSRDPETSKEKETQVGTTRAMWKLVKSGKMTEGQVIVATLQVLAGEKATEEVFGDANVVMVESTMLILIARSYLHSNKDPKFKEEIKRLLSKLTTNVRILRHPDKTSGLGSSGHDNTSPPNRFSLFSSLIPSAQAASSECRKAWRHGDFRDEVRHCWNRKEEVLHGRVYTVHYPNKWQIGSKEYRYVEAAAEGMRKAVNKYRTFGRMYDVDFVFVLKQPRDINREGQLVISEAGLRMEDFQPVTVRDRGTWTPAPWCVVSSFPNARDFGTTGKKEYQQAVAHELWHCFQTWHLYPQYFQGRKDGLTIAWGDVVGWWVEGSAEYYSNLVYPRVNLEHRLTESFDEESLETSILQLAVPYSSFGFFQFLANQPGVGAAGVLRFLKSLPSEGGFKEQADALASFGDMKKTFNQFGRDYLDGKIKDTGGGFIPFRPQFGDKVQINKPGKYKVSAEQFHLERRQLIFSGWQFKVQTQDEGAPGKDNSKEPPEKIWGHLPESITTGCKRTYKLLLTSADESAFGQDYKFIIDVKSDIKTQTRRAKIDKCLVGTWEIQNPSHDSVVRSAISKTRMNVRFQSSGKQTTHFTKGCKATMTFKNYKTKAKFSYPAMAFLNTTTTSNGTDTVDYIAAGGVITFSNLKEGMCARMETKGRVKISRRKGWRNIRTTTTECGPYAKGKNAGKRQTTTRAGGKSYDVSKMQKAFDMKKFFKFREQQLKKMRDSGFDPNEFLAKYGRSPRSGGSGRRIRPGKVQIPNIGMPMGQAKKEDSLFMGKVAYNCSGNRLTMRTIEPTTSDKSWEFRRVKK